MWLKISTALLDHYRPVAAPFIGGYLQHIFNWHANFYGYAIYGIFNLLLVYLFHPETLQAHHKVTGTALQRYLSVFRNRQFQIYAPICGLLFIEFMMYNLVGPFIVEIKMGYSAVVFGHTALMVGGGYFAGTLFNRLLLRHISPNKAINLGLTIIAGGTALIYVLGITLHAGLYTLVLPIVAMTFGTGITFPNAITKCLSPFSKNAGSAACMHGGTVRFLGFILTGFISHIHIETAPAIAIVLAVIWLAQIILIVLARRAGV